MYRLIGPKTLAFSQQTLSYGMKIGIIGLGVVGSAIKEGFEKIGHRVFVHDTKCETSIRDLENTEIAFICVPTPSLGTGKCDVSIVESVINELDAIDYAGIIAIKSTVEPGFTERLQHEYPSRILCYVPEFLRERCAISDFMENHDLCVIGTKTSCVFEIIKSAHGKYPKKTVRLLPTEAELVKYFINVYNATLVTFANNFYEICEKMNVDYTTVKNAAVNRSHITDSYLDCNDNFKGFGGVCLPKDTHTISQLANELQTKGRLFQAVLSDNEQFETTVFDGMREM